MTIKDAGCLWIEKTSLADLVSEVKTGALTPSELVSRVLEKIWEKNHVLNAFITVLEEKALEEAEEADKEIKAGRYRGPLHGIPVSLTDVFYVKGFRCTAGSKILAENVAGYDSTVSMKLREAGAIITGFTNLDEFSLGATGYNPHYGAIKNPWNVEFISGGACGGSAAAIAAGLSTVSIGLDADGSVRIPASLCGVVGLKPTYGRVSKHGVIPRSWSLDHVGIFTSTAMDAAIVLKHLAGYDPADESSVYAEVPDYPAMVKSMVDGLRVCIFSDVGFCNGEVMRKFKEFIHVLESLGIAVEEIDFSQSTSQRTCWETIALAETAAFHDQWFKTNEKDYGEVARKMILKGRAYSATDYIKALKTLREIKDAVLKILDDYDAIVSPTTPATAVKVAAVKGFDAEATEIYNMYTAQTILYNLAGIPAVSVPAGFSSNGLPIGVQVAGRLFDEVTILRIAHHAMMKMGSYR